MPFNQLQQIHATFAQHYLTQTTALYRLAVSINDHLQKILNPKVYNGLLIAGCKVPSPCELLLKYMSTSWFHEAWVANSFTKAEFTTLCRQCDVFNHELCSYLKNPELEVLLDPKAYSVNYKKLEEGSISIANNHDGRKFMKAAWDQGFRDFPPHVLALLQAEYGIELPSEDQSQQPSNEASGSLSSTSSQESEQPALSSPDSLSSTHQVASQALECSVEPLSSSDQTVCSDPVYTE